MSQFNMCGEYTKFEIDSYKYLLGGVYWVRLRMAISCTALKQGYLGASPTTGDEALFCN